MIQLVSENSPEDVARNRALEEIGWTLRDLTANLLRVTRGAGKAYAIGSQALAVVQRIQAYRDVAGVWPSTNELEQMLKLDAHPDPYSLPDREFETYYAERDIIRGALQVAASQLLDQPMQERAGESQMYNGVSRLEDVRQAERQEFAAKAPAQRRKDAAAALEQLRAEGSQKKKKRD